jgi:hypothetical protein
VQDGRTPLVINEFMAANGAFLRGPQGEYEDWIEFYNGSDAPVDVGGLYLTDDPAVPTRWRFPRDEAGLTTVPARGFLVVWADGDATAPGLHAGFRLDAEGGILCLFDSDGRTLIDSVAYGRQEADLSYGRSPDAAADWRFLLVPTPAAPNAPGYQGRVAAVRFSHERGFCDGPFEVAISCDTPGATIYYTTDGSAPYQLGGRIPSGIAYTRPIPIVKTTCLRAAALKQDWLPAGIGTQTYLFLQDVIRQPAQPAGFPNSWRGIAADYQMDPQVVSDPRYSGMMENTLLSLPTMSLVMANKDLFDSATGIYANPENGGVTWERPGSIELIYPDGTEGFQANCGVRIQGGWFRAPSASPKHSFRLLFKRAYGLAELRYPLFGSDAVDEFDSIVLRAGANDGYAWDAAYLTEQYTRDEFGRQLQAATGNAAVHGRFVHLYVNGLYWGLYNPCERPDASFSASYYGNDEDNWDALHDGSPHAGDTQAWSQMIALCQQAASSPDAYQKLQGNNPDGTRNPDYPHLLDVPNYIDYLIVNLWGGNWDWPWKNWWAGRDRSPASTGFKFYCWDYENTMGNNRDRSPLNKNALQNSFSSVGQPHQYLKQNAEYRMLFADRVHRLFFHDGPLTPAPLIARYTALASIVEMAMMAESARWGDVHHHPPLTQQQWYAERDWILKTYLPQRTDIVLSQFRSAGLYPNLDAPVFYVNADRQHGGHITPSDSLKMRLAGAGTIFYTLDGSDPRPLSRGAPSGGDNSIILVPENAPKRVLVPTGPVDSAWQGGGIFDDSGWISGTGGVGFERSVGYEHLFTINLSEQMYGKQATCYVRIPFTLDRDTATLGVVQLRVRYDDGFVAHLNGVEVARRNISIGVPAWNAAADAQNPDTAAVDFEDISLPNAGSYLKTGQNILAVQALNQSTTSSDFLFSVMLVADPDTSGPAGSASTTAVKYTGPLTLDKSTQVKARVLSGGTWSALNEAVFAVGPVAESLRVSEIMYHPAQSGNPDDPNTEYLELTNVGTQTINLNLVHFTQGIEYTFPSFELPAGGYCLIVKDLAAWVETQNLASLRLPVVGRYAGSLNNGGERIELVDAAGQVIQSLEYQDNWYDITDGRGFSLTVKDPPGADANSLSSKSFWRPSAQVGGSPGVNDSGQVPELGSVVINELLANSQGVGPDWIELYNSTNQTLSVGGWFLSDDANNLTKYQIAPGTSIPAGGYLVFYENKHFGNQADPGCQEPFALSKDGETLYLHSGSGGVLSGYSEQEKFDASEAGVSLGRWQKSTGTYNFVALSTPTPGQANAAPAVGPVVITEIMYHPQDGADAEYVELLNISGSPVTLYDAAQNAAWRFSDGEAVELLLPADAPVTLAAGEYLVLAKDATLVRAKYAVPETVQVLAWGPGNLADSGAKLQLSKPGEAEEDGTCHWLRVDRVVYSDGSHPQDFAEGMDPWPVQANGQGQSLSRLDPHAYGNDPDNWKAATPSPGRAN